MPIKGRSRALLRECWPRGEDGTARAGLSLPPTRTLVTPYCKRTRPGRRTNTKATGFPFTPVSQFFPPSCSISRRPIWAGTRGDNLLVGPGTPRGRNADNMVQIQRSKKPSVPWSGAPDCPVCHRTVSSAPGPYSLKLATIGFLRARSAIIHRTVWCDSGATTTSRNGRLQKLQIRATMKNSAHRVRAAHQRRTGH
jgi:hypothetical protein